jgi:O-antigen/teichoic acid export membrane protein
VLIVRGRYDVRSLFFVVSGVLRLGGLAAGATIGVTEALLGLLAGQALASAILGAAALAAFRRFPASPAVPLGEDRGPFTRFVLQSALGSGLVSMRGLLGTVVVGLVANARQAGYFRIAQAPVTGLTALSSPARLILLTEQTRDFERGDHARLDSLLRRYVVATALLAAVIVPVSWWLMPELIRIAFGDEYLPAVDATRLLVIAAALHFVWGWTKSYPVSIGRPGLRTLAYAVEAAVFVPLVVVLASRWEAPGAAAAQLASTAVYAVVWTVLLVRVRREGPPRTVEAYAP